MKRFISFIMSIVLVMALIPITASAETYHKTIKSKKFYYIEHVGSGLLLDVDSEHLNDNGTQLQIWEKCRGNQNQVFVLIDTGNGWTITSYASKKIIEVRDSSHEDYTEVAQWDDNEQKCGRWNIIYNTEGTTAEKFKLHPIKTSDVLSATWTRKIFNDEIHWSDSGYSLNVNNFTEWTKNDLRSYPTPGYEYLVHIDYLDPKTVGEIIKSRAYIDDGWSQIKDIVRGEATEETVAKALSILGIDDIPFLGGAVSVIQTLWKKENKNEKKKYNNSKFYNSNNCFNIRNSNLHKFK